MKMRAVRIAVDVLALSALVVAAGCGSSSPTAPSTPAGTLSRIQTEILTPSCVSCHTDEGRTPAAGLNLRSGAAFAALVGVASSGKPGAVRVIAGNAAGSYLVQKLEGAADIVGLRMPRNQPPFLSEAQIALVRQWIQSGAPNN